MYDVHPHIGRLGGNIEGEIGGAARLRGEGVRLVVTGQLSPKYQGRKARFLTNRAKDRHLPGFRPDAHRRRVLACRPLDSPLARR